MITPVDSKEQWEEKAASVNAGISALLYEVLADDDKAWGCKRPVSNYPDTPYEPCDKVSFFRVQTGEDEGMELCQEHAMERGDKCSIEECPYANTHLHMDTPWDYDVNAPASDDPKWSMCYHHAHMPL